MDLLCADLLQYLCMSGCAGTAYCSPIKEVLKKSRGDGVLRSILLNGTIPAKPAQIGNCVESDRSTQRRLG